MAGRLHPWLVPEYEEREAARFVVVSWRDWQELGEWDRAMAVAHLRLHGLVTSHSSDAVVEKQKRDSATPAD